MSRISRLAVLVTALASLFAVLSSTAGAVTFTNTGGTNFHATSGPGTLTITSTPDTSLACQDATATGTVGMGVFTAIQGSATFTRCALAGIHTEVSCSYTLTPLNPIGTPTTSVHGVADVHCTAGLATAVQPLCTISGQVTGTYTNPIAPSTAGKLTLQNQGGLTVSNVSDASCSVAGVPTGATRPGDLSETTFNLTSFANSPNVVSP